MVSIYTCSNREKHLRIGCNILDGVDPYEGPGRLYGSGGFNSTMMMLHGFPRVDNRASSERIQVDG